MKGTFWNATDETFHLDEMSVHFVDILCWRLIYFGFWTGLFVVAFILHIFVVAPQKRKTSIYRLHLIAIPLTIIFNINQIMFWYVTFRITWFKPEEFANKAAVNYMVMLNELLIHFVPLLGESTLILQFATFFPRPLYSIWARSGILAPFAILLAARLGISIASATFVIRSWNYTSAVPYSPFPIVKFTDWLMKARITALIEYILGMIYCFMASAFLLYKAYKFVHLSKMTFRTPIERKLRFLTEAIFMCFLPPTALTIAGVTARMKPSASMVNSLYQQQNITSALVNISVLFALFATSWSNVRAYADEKIASQKSARNDSDIMVDSIVLVESDNESSSSNQNHLFQAHERMSKQ